MEDHITVSIGPVMYLTDSIDAPEKGPLFRVLIADLSKPHMSALTFILPDSDATLEVSHLRIVGWNNK